MNDEQTEDILYKQLCDMADKAESELRLALIEVEELEVDWEDLRAAMGAGQVQARIGVKK